MDPVYRYDIAIFIHEKGKVSVIELMDKFNDTSLEEILRQLDIMQNKLSNPEIYFKAGMYISKFNI